MEGRPLEDAELVDLARDGDVHAYEVLVSRYQGIAYRVAWLVARQAGEAEDAVQEAFVKAYYALPRFRPGAPFRPWLLRIVANEARNRRRTETRQARLWARAVEQEVSGDAAPSPETVVVSAERRVALLTALAALREDDRAVLGCRFLVGLSEQETASALGLRRGTVKSRTARALARLREAGGEGVVA